MPRKDRLREPVQSSPMSRQVRDVRGGSFKARGQVCCRNEKRDALKPMRKHRKRNRGARKKRKPIQIRLLMIWVSCMVFVTLATISPKDEKVAEPSVTSRRDRPEVSPTLHVKHQAADQNFNRDGRKSHEIVRKNAGRQQRARRQEARAGTGAECLARGTSPAARSVPRSCPSPSA